MGIFRPPPKGATAPSGPGPHYGRFTILIGHIALGRTPLEFEPTIPASERRHTHALDRVATGISSMSRYINVILNRCDQVQQQPSTLNS